MTDTELTELESLAKAATPGPWDCGGVEVFLGEWNPLIAMCNSEDNAAYIAAANPAVVLELIAELRQAKAERDWLAKEVATITGSKSNKWLQAAKDATCQKN